MKRALIILACLLAIVAAGLDVHCKAVTAPPATVVLACSAGRIHP